VGWQVKELQTEAEKLGEDGEVEKAEEVMKKIQGLVSLFLSVLGKNWKSSSVVLVLSNAPPSFHSLLYLCSRVFQ
jgi:hypothetical protein